MITDEEFKNLKVGDKVLITSLNWAIFRNMETNAIGTVVKKVQDTICAKFLGNTTQYIVSKEFIDKVVSKKGNTQMITYEEFEKLKKGDRVLIKDKYKKAELVVEVLETNYEFALIKDGEFQDFIPMNLIIKILPREDKQEIHIYRKGNEVHAIEKKNGEVVNKAIAKCSPKDEFDFSMGAKTAFKRLKSQKSLLSVIESAKKTFEPYPWQVEAHEAFNNHKPQFVVHTESRLNPKVINYTISLKSAGKSFDQLVKEIEDVCTKEDSAKKEMAETAKLNDIFYKKSANSTDEDFKSREWVFEAFGSHKDLSLAPTHACNCKYVSNDFGIPEEVYALFLISKILEQDKEENPELIKEVNNLAKEKICELHNSIKEEEKSSIKNGTRVRIKNMDVFKEVNEINPEVNFVCLEEYIGKCGKVYKSDDLRKDFLISFDEEYMNAIDNKNDCLYFTKDQVEII